MLILKGFLIVALIKMLVEMEKPILCAGIYTGLGALFNLMFGVPANVILVVAFIVFGLSYGYFWLLDWLQDSFLFWVVLIFGLPIILL